MNKIVHVTTALDCTPAQAWAMFTDVEHAKAWLAPKMTIGIEVGGAYELAFDGTPDNIQRGTIAALTPYKLLAFTWQAPPRSAWAFINDARPLTLVTIRLWAEDGLTFFDLLHTGWLSSADWQAARRYYQVYWEAALLRLVMAIGAMRLQAR